MTILVSDGNPSCLNGITSLGPCVSLSGKRWESQARSMEEGCCRWMSSTVCGWAWQSKGRLAGGCPWVLWSVNGAANGRQLGATATDMQGPSGKKRQWKQLEIFSVSFPTDFAWKKPIGKIANSDMWPRELQLSSMQARCQIPKWQSFHHRDAATARSSKPVLSIIHSILS